MLDNLELKRRAWRGLAQLTIAIGLSVLLPGGLQYREGWVFLCVFVFCSAVITLDIQSRDPALLERRLCAGPGAEQRARQKAIQGLVSLTFIASMLVPAFDHRYGWSQLPRPIVILGDLLVGLGFWAVFLVFRENTFAAAVIEVGTEQKVIDSGPYALVRHPMYAGGLVLFSGIPLALGSLWGLCLLPLFAGLIVWRLLDEEALLSERLPGYRSYCKKTRYRLIPYVW